MKAGDPVGIFILPDKRIMITKSKSSNIKVEGINSGYISFDQPINIKGGNNVW